MKRTAKENLSKDRDMEILVLWHCLIPHADAVAPVFVFIYIHGHVFATSLCASVYMCLEGTCWEKADLLALVCGV